MMKGVWNEMPMLKRASLVSDMPCKPLSLPPELRDGDR